MTSNIEKLQSVATSSELYAIEIEFRTIQDDYNNQKIGSVKPLFSMVDSEINNLISDIQRRTWDAFGGAGMVMSYSFAPALGVDLKKYYENI